MLINVLLATLKLRILNYKHELSLTSDKLCRLLKVAILGATARVYHVALVKVVVHMLSMVMHIRAM